MIKYSKNIFTFSFDHRLKGEKLIIVCIVKHLLNVSLKIVINFQQKHVLIETAKYRW